eukprot:10230061-Lingulodinium_polyedra.AAC.1
MELFQAQGFKRAFEKRPCFAPGFPVPPRGRCRRGVCCAARVLCVCLGGRQRPRSREGVEARVERAAL